MNIPWGYLTFIGGLVLLFGVNGFNLLGALLTFVGFVSQMITWAAQGALVQLANKEK